MQNQTSRTHDASPASKTASSNAASSNTASFSSLGLRPELLRAIDDLGFTEPTPIQLESIPPGLDGRDVLACAATGSGKTAAFLLPIMQRLLDDPRPGETRALVLTPTRELAEQIVEHFHELARHTKLRAASVYGGVGMNPQVKAFKQGVDLIVACPGRLLDHFQYDYAHLDGLDVLVLDEVDRMLDMGFLPDIKRILGHLPADVDQALFFSATLPKEIVRLVDEMLHDPVKIAVERDSRPAAGIEQSFWPVPHQRKKDLLLELLQREHLDDVLVFTRTKRGADRLAKFLGKKGISSDRIHGNRSQNQRTRTLAKFKAGKTRVLCATDVASRGIDVEELSHVVNFDIPHVADDYIHRVGRTARAGATGDAFSFVTPKDRNQVRAIERAVGREIERRTLEDFDYGESNGNGNGNGHHRGRQNGGRNRGGGKSRRRRRNQGRRANA